MAVDPSLQTYRPRSLWRAARAGLLLSALSILIDPSQIHVVLNEPAPDMLSYMAGRLTAAPLLFVAVTMALNGSRRRRARRLARRLEAPPG